MKKLQFRDEKKKTQPFSYIKCKRGGIFWLWNSQDIQCSSAKLEYISARKNIFMFFSPSLNTAKATHRDKIQSDKNLWYELYSPVPPIFLN